jgi:hypothetical protein
MKYSNGIWAAIVRLWTRLFGRHLKATKPKENHVVNCTNQPATNSKRRASGVVPSPYTKGTTLNKKASDIAERMRGRRLTFKDAYNEVMTLQVIKTHNQGEFKRYPPKGDSSLMSLMKLAVGRKLGTVIS